MLDAVQIATSGMAAASDRLASAAQKVASLGVEPTSSVTLPPAARVDLSSTALDVIGAKVAFGLNAAVLRTADQMSKRLLDVTA